jgi:hypothetical protein
MNNMPFEGDRPRDWGAAEVGLRYQQQGARMNTLHRITLKALNAAVHAASQCSGGSTVLCDTSMWGQMGTQADGHTSS